VPMKITAGVGRKLGLPEYSSLSASCHVEFEADAGLLQGDLEGFQQRVRRAYAACAQAVREELARQQADGAAHASLGHGGSGPASQPSAGPGGNGTRVNRNGTNGNGHRNSANGYGASEKQIGYARQLAKQIEGLGIRRLETLSQKMFNKPLTALTSMDCSTLIDTLKSIKAGQIDLAQVLEGSTP